MILNLAGSVQKKLEEQAVELAAIKKALFDKKTEKHKLPPPLPPIKPASADIKAIRKSASRPARCGPRDRHHHAARARCGVVLPGLR